MDIILSASDVAGCDHARVQIFRDPSGRCRLKLICTMPVRSEEWIIGLTARAALMWCDELICCDHWSTDRTHEILWQIRDEVGPRLTITEWRDEQWTEMAQRQSMLELAREHGATHIVCVDADEVLTANLLPSFLGINMTELVRVNTPRTHVLQLPWIQLRGSIHRMHNTGTWADQQVSVAFQDSPELHWAARDGYDFHHRHPMGRECIPYRPLQRSQGGLMHLQMVSERRLRAKQLNYCLQEKLRWPGREPVDVVRERYSLAVYGDQRQAANGVPNWAPINARAGEVPPKGEPFADVPAEWWSGYEHLLKHLDVESEPWQFAECQRMLRENPGIEEGLDDFGLGLFPSAFDHTGPR